MARDPNELKFPESWKESPDDLKTLPKPEGIPDAELYGGDYYANVKIYQNGRRTVEWYKRKTGTPGAPTPDDPVAKRSEDVMPVHKAAWDKEEEQQDSRGPTLRYIRGVPHQLTKDDEGHDLWVPVQTPSGPATAAPGNQRTPEQTRVDQITATKAEEDERERSWHRAQGHGNLTHAEYDEQQRRRGVETRAQEDQAAQNAARNAPKIVLTPDSTQAVYTWPDGRVEVRPTGLKAPPKPGQIVKGGGLNGEDVQAVTNEQGQIEYRPIQGAQVPAENRSLPKGAPKYVPDYDLPDLGLTAYNEALIQAEQAGLITREQGGNLIRVASGLATQTASHGTTLRNQQQQTRNQDITQRAQDINETQSRRSFQGAGFDSITGDVGRNARYLGVGGGDIALNAVKAMLAVRQQYAADAGGFTDSPQVPVSPALQAIKTTILPGGAVQIEHPMSPAQAENVPGPPSIPMTPERVQGIMSNPVFRPQAEAQVSPSYAPDPSQIDNPMGVPSYLRPEARSAPQWDPTPVIARLRAQGVPDDIISEELNNHVQEYGYAG